MTRVEWGCGGGDADALDRTSKAVTFENSDSKSDRRSAEEVFVRWSEFPAANEQHNV